MAKGKYHEWLKPEKLLLVRKWRRDGLTIEQTAKAMGVNPDTVYTWIKRFPEIAEALKTGKEEANAIIENKLFQKALSGNMTAIIFYLKNNWRDKYNDSQLSLDELKLAKARSRKTNAEADIAEYKAQVFKDSGSSGVELLNEYLDKLDTLAGKEVKEDGPKTDV